MSISSGSKEPVTQAVNEFLAFLVSEHPKIRKLVIALSGGKDSVCLLNALSKHAKNFVLQAVYIDHGLQAESLEWGTFNQELCETLGINYSSVKVVVNRRQASLEQAARNARYQALSQFVDAQSCLVTAQHQDDQAETVLLQLLRSAGVKGLSAMPYSKCFAAGWHARPLLKVSQDAIADYIQKYQLKHIEDNSNQDIAFSRNFLRHKIIPELSKHWPQVSETLANSAENFAATQLLLEELAQLDYQDAFDQSRLDISKLEVLSSERQSNLLRYWFAKFNIKMPSRVLLQEIKSQFLNTQSDINPCIDIEAYQLRRYKNHIYLLSDPLEKFNPSQEWQWTLTNNFNGANKQTILVKDVLEMWPELRDQQVIVRYRAEGDKFYHPNKEHGQTLKNYFQENDVPSWLRASALLVVYQGKVIFVQKRKLL
ncbi:tRNA lysidine(34) synthetase TilS [Kangiella sp. HZ709]|uniref:tRNA lysidine(34) synthetase TilS n=1 Tax=Kangiella sp. HZ709 TaxID=2666328 RepID=UPI0012B0CA16|nr:tRNA lysidine(34) synthetase TilS [Kangiella sp. HZ709]MRX28309.1 tRNA lysidine(34) synthetase TilS [Kangiella sp. HZ709]